MHLAALVLPLFTQATVDLSRPPSPAPSAPVLAAYSPEAFAALTPAVAGGSPTHLRLGALSILRTRAATDERAHELLSRLLRQRTAHLDHCARHAPDLTELQVELTFDTSPRVHAEAAEAVSACLEELADHWPVPDELAGTRASLRLIVERP